MSDYSKKLLIDFEIERIVFAFRSRYEECFVLLKEILGKLQERGFDIEKRCWLGGDYDLGVSRQTPKFRKMIHLDISDGDPIVFVSMSGYGDGKYYVHEMKKGNMLSNLDDVVDLFLNDEK